MFAALGLNRRDALWEAKALRAPAPLPLFGGDIEGEGIIEPAAHLPQMGLGEQVVEDYAAMRLSLRAHPVALIRHLLTPSDTPSDTPPDTLPDTPPDTVSNAGPAWR